MINQQRINIERMKNWNTIGGQYRVRIAGLLTGLDLYIEGPVAGVNFYLDNVLGKVQAAG